MKARTLLVGVVLWAGVVAVGSGITWLVIEHVGRSVISGQGSSSTNAVTGVPAPSSPSGPSRTSSSGPSSPGSTTRPSPATTSPRPTPPSSTPAATPGGRPPRATDPVTPRQVPREVHRTWSGGAGHLTVSCTGARVGLVSASPSDGWRVEIGSRGPEEVQVEFQQGGEGGAETHVKARCSGGAPRFEVENDD